MAPIRKQMTSQGAGSSKKSGHDTPPREAEQTVNSRKKEHTQLKNLNGRLASYIETVRRLESELTICRKQIHTIQESKSSEIVKIRTTYEGHVNDLQATIDDISTEKAKLEIDFANAVSDVNSLKEKLKFAENKVHDYNDILEQNKALVSEKQVSISKIKNIEQENQKLNKTINELKRNLEAETMARVGVENKLQSATEALYLKTQLIEEALHTTYERTETSELDGPQQQLNDHSGEIQCSLENLREQYENDVVLSRHKIENLYRKKIDNYEMNIQKNSLLIHKLNENINELETKNAVLSHRLVDLEKNLAEERACYKNDKERYDDEIASLRSELDIQLKEYEDLMDSKIVLDIELAAYRKMLEAEESRLNMSTDAEEGYTSGKRKKVTLRDDEYNELQDFNISSTSNGPIEIIDICKDGSYVKLLNKSEGEIALGGWKIVRKVAEKEITYVFHRNSKLEAGATVTVWSLDSNQTHEPPSNLVMKNQKWLNGDNMITNVLNNDGEEVAHHKRMKSFEMSRTRKNKRFKYNPEEIFHQRGLQHDLNNTENRCCIM